MLDENVEEKLNSVISEVKDSKEFKKCLEIKNIMNQNKEITKLIEDIKSLQKKYIATNDKSIKEKLEEKKLKLDNIPIYCEYNNKIQEVNEKIEFIKEYMNEYFNEKINNNI